MALKNKTFYKGLVSTRLWTELQAGFISQIVLSLWSKKDVLKGNMSQKDTENFPSTLESTSTHQTSLHFCARL